MPDVSFQLQFVFQWVRFLDHLNSFSKVLTWLIATPWKVNGVLGWWHICPVSFILRDGVDVSIWYSWHRRFINVYDHVACEGSPTFRSVSNTAFNAMFCFSFWTNVGFAKIWLICSKSRRSWTSSRLLSIDSLLLLFEFHRFALLIQHLWPQNRSLR